MENENALLCLQEPVIASHCGLDKSSSPASQSVIKNPFLVYSSTLREKH